MVMTKELARSDSCTRNASSLSTALEAAGAAKEVSDNCTVVSFLQDQASDDELLRVCTFLECRDLVRLSATCTRLCRLVQVSATDQVHGRRNEDIVTSSSAGGQSRSVSLQYLRILEQLQGIAPNDPVTVSIPVLLLPLRILVQDCGDDDYNGIYFCTGINGNGYVFSKPYRTIEMPSSERDAMERTTTTASSRNNSHSSQSLALHSTSSTGSSHPGQCRKPNLLPPWLEQMDDTGLAMGSALGTCRPGPCGNAAAPRRLRCILAKNFSNEVRDLSTGG
jgi:hypothetical protein